MLLSYGDVSMLLKYAFDSLEREPFVAAPPTRNKTGVIPGSVQTSNACAIQ
jgi:hypothetical protein